MLAAPVRRAKRIGRRLIPPRPIVNLNRAILYIVVLIQLIKVPTVIGGGRVHSIAPNVLRSEVGRAKKLLMLWRK